MGAKAGLGALLCLIPIAAMAAPPIPADATGAPVADDCPPTMLRPPAYPADVASRNKGGTVVLELTIDRCGRVRKAAIKSGSGHRALNQAALAAAQRWVLPESEVARAVNGRLERVVPFDPVTQLVVPYADVNWPPSHKRPTYRLDDADLGFASADEARTSMRVSADRHMKPPYKGVVNEFFLYGDPPDYWLFIVRDGRPNVAARYRLSMEGGEPIVDVGIICDDQPDACAMAQASLLAGLPFAKAR